MQRFTGLQITTYGLGLSIIYISITNLAMFLAGMGRVFWTLGLLFGLFLPLAVKDPRVNLRGVGCCCAWWAVALLMTAVYVPFAPAVVSACLVGAVALGGIPFLLNKDAGAKRKLRRRNQGTMRVSNGTLLVCGWYAITLILFPTTGMAKGLPVWICAVLLFASLLFTVYVCYYWSWSLRVQEEGYVLRNFGRNCTHSFRDIQKVKHIPAVGYFAFDQRKKLLFRFSFCMENCVAVWREIRSQKDHD